MVVKVMMMMRQMQVERVNLFIYVFIYYYSYFLSSSFWRGYDSPRVDYGAPHASGMPRCCSQIRVAGKSGLQANQARCGGCAGGFDGVSRGVAGRIRGLRLISRLKKAYVLAGCVRDQ